MRISERSKNPPIIIALNSNPVEDYDEIEENYYMNSDFISSLIRRENEIKKAELFYTKYLIKKITKYKVESNEQVKNLHD